MPTASLTAAVSSQSKPVARSVGVHRGEQNFARAAGFGFARPLDDAASRGLAPALHKDLRVAHRIGGFGIAARVDGDDDGLRAKAAADGVDQSWVGQRGGVHAHLVRAGLEDLRRIVRGANAAADAKGNKQLTRGAAHGVEQRLPALVRRGNVEQHDFVRAFAGMARGLRGRIARIDEIDELHALDDTAVMHIEAGDDALGNHSVPFPGEKIAENLQPGCAGLFRMKLHAHHVAALDGGCKGLNVVRDGRGVGCNGSFVGVGEVDELARLDAGKEMGTFADFERVPAYVRDFFLAFGKARARIQQNAQGPAAQALRSIPRRATAFRHRCPGKERRAQWPRESRG